jgi:hypothetical protein
MTSHDCATATIAPSAPSAPVVPDSAAAGPRLLTGTVCGRAGAWLFVRGSEGEQRAQVAPSCLLAPEDGDVVLLCLAPDMPLAAPREGAMSVLPCRQHVLAVLSRAAPAQAQATVQLPGGARFVVQEGSVRIEGREVDIAASTGLRARTPQFTLEAAHGDLRFGHANASAGSFTGVIGHLQLFARDLGTQVDRLVQKVRSSFRTVEELDDLRAGRTRWEVEGHAQLHARQATVLAEGTVKIDGQRIDLG